MGHLVTYKYFGCNGQGLHRVRTTLCVASMQKYGCLQNVMALLAAERESSYIRLDETLTSTVLRVDRQ